VGGGGGEGVNGLVADDGGVERRGEAFGEDRGGLSLVGVVGDSGFWYLDAKLEGWTSAE
jgi:hypothetical protein